MQYQRPHVLRHLPGRILPRPRAVAAACLSLALAVTSAAPAMADRQRHRSNEGVVAGALVLGLIGAAIAGQRRQARDEFSLNGPDVMRLMQSPADQIFPGDTVPGAIYITPRREIYYGPGGATPGLRPGGADGPLTGSVTIAPAVKPHSTTQIAGQAGIRVEPLFAPTGPRRTISGFVADPVVTPQVTVQPLRPLASPGIDLPDDLFARTVPAQCLRTYDQNGENRALYSPECLVANTAFAASLPVSCAVTLRTLGRFVSGYDPSCLVAAGYRLAGS